MENVSDTVSTVYSNLKNLNNSKQYDGKEILRIIGNLPDVIPQDGYTGYYVNRFKELGYERFMELVKKARTQSDTPQHLFAWMLKNNDQVH